MSNLMAEHLERVNIFSRHSENLEPTTIHWPAKRRSLFWARSQNFKKRLLPSSCLSVLPSVYLSVCPYGNARLPLVGF